MAPYRLKGLYKYRDSKNWWFRFTDPETGKRRAVSLGTDDEAKAIQEARAILGGNLMIDAAPTGTLTREIDSYLIYAQQREKKAMTPGSARNVRYALRVFIKDTGITSLDSITVPLVTAWVRGLKAAGKSQDTLRSYASYLKTLTRYLHTHGKMRKDLLEKYELPGATPQGRQNWLKKDVVKRIIEAAGDDDHLKFILYCGFHAGLRRNEIGMAKVGWFDVDAGLLHAQNMPDEAFTLKDRDNRTIDLTNEFRAFLTRYLEGRDNPGEFVLCPNKTERGANKYRYDFRRLVESHFRKVGVDCSCHDMRRSFASNLVSAGVSIYTISRWLGDRVDVVERHYGYLAPGTGEINKLV
jgi:integrase